MKINLNGLTKLNTRLGGFAGPILILILIGLGQFWWTLVPLSVTLILILAVAITSLTWSVRNNSLKMALATLAAALLGPLLLNIAPSDLGTPLYLAVLALSLPAIAWWRYWPLYNLAALAGISLVYHFWFESYTPGLLNPDLVSSFIFSALYFGLYLLTSLITHGVQKHNSHSKDLFFIATAMGLFALTTYNYFYDTFSGYFGYLAMALCLSYYLLWQGTKHWRGSDKPLAKTLGLISVFLATVAIPLSFSAKVAVWIWLLEASLIFVLSYQVRRYRRHVH